MRDTKANATVRCRISNDVKQFSKQILATIGLTHSDAIRITLTRLANEGKLRTELLDTDKPALDMLMKDGEVYEGSRKGS